MSPVNRRRTSKATMPALRAVLASESQGHATKTSIQGKCSFPFEDQGVAELLPSTELPSYRLTFYLPATQNRGPMRLDLKKLRPKFGYTTSAPPLLMKPSPHSVFRAPKPVQRSHETIQRTGDKGFNSRELPPPIPSAMIAPPRSTWSTPLVIPFV